MKPVTHAMLAKADAALQAARRDLAAADPQNAVGRAYYAVFHGASAALHEIGIHFRSHKGAHTLFAEHFVKSGRFPVEMSVTFSRLQGLREYAEYNVGATISETDAEQAIEQADRFITVVRESLI